MTYFKLISNGSIIGAATTYDLRKIQEKHNIIVTSELDDAQFIQLNERMFHDVWMRPFYECTTEIFNATIVSIGEEEYLSIQKAIDSNESIPDVLEPPVQDDGIAQIQVEDQITIDFVKSQKLNEINAVCNKMIKTGFDVKLEDGALHHFSLDYSDQINLITISAMLSSGEQMIPYHADGELCKLYSANDIKAILDKATQLKTYHTTYTNALRAYVSSLDSIEKISMISYGDDIPSEFKSDVYYLVVGKENE